MRTASPARSSRWTTCEHSPERGGKRSATLSSRSRGATAFIQHVHDTQVPAISNMLMHKLTISKPVQPRSLAHLCPVPVLLANLPLLCLMYTLTPYFLDTHYITTLGSLFQLSRLEDLSLCPSCSIGHFPAVRLEHDCLAIRQSGFDESLRRTFE